MVCWRTGCYDLSSTLVVGWAPQHSKQRANSSLVDRLIPQKNGNICLKQLAVGWSKGAIGVDQCRCQSTGIPPFRGKRKRRYCPSWPTYEVNAFIFHPGLRALKTCCSSGLFLWSISKCWLKLCVARQCHSNARFSTTDESQEAPKETEYQCASVFTRSKSGAFIFRGSLAKDLLLRSTNYKWCFLQQGG